MKELCNAEYTDKIWFVHHVCMLEKNHDGQHKCKNCIAEWTDKQKGGDVQCP